MTEARQSDPIVSEPVFWTDHSTYRVTYPEPECVEFEFGFVRDSRDGINAEVAITSTLPGMRETLYEGRINLLAGETLKRVGTTVRERSTGQGSLDWHGMLMRACQEVKRSWRQGDPPILLRDAEDPGGSAYLLPPILLGRHPTILFGRGGSAKSLLALAMAAAIHCDDPTLLGIAPEQRLRVGLLDWEFGAWEHRTRLQALCGPTMPDLVYVRCHGALRDQVDKVKQIVRDHSLGYLLVDSIGPALGGDPLSSEVALGFYNALRTIGLGALCVAHVAKNGDEETPFGSVFFENMARQTWLVKKVHEEEQETLTVGLFNKKTNVGKLSRPIAFKIHFGDHGRKIEIKRTDVNEIDEFAASQPISELVKKVLDEGGSMTAVEITNELQARVPGIKPNTLYTTLRRMRGRNEVAELAATTPGAVTHWRLVDRPIGSRREHPLPDEEPLPW